MASTFINEINSIISGYQITPENVLNLDQLPRYYEQSSNKTLAFVGAKKVEIVKAVNNHKRFTFTPLISASGSMEKIHILFSNLKRVPKNLNLGCIVEVNQSGMWNKQIFERFIEKHVLTRPQTNENTLKSLLIVDSFSGHLGLEDKYLIIRYVPPRLTGILRVLDVYYNRGFQQYYGSKYDTWLSLNIDNPTIFTKNGNLKAVPYSIIVDWCLSYQKQVSSELIKNGFKGCGISFDSFSLDQCHSQLKFLLKKENEETEKLSMNQIFYSDVKLVNISQWDLKSEYQFLILSLRKK